MIKKILNKLFGNKSYGQVEPSEPWHIDPVNFNLYNPSHYSKAENFVNENCEIRKCKHYDIPELYTILSAYLLQWNLIIEQKEYFNFRSEYEKRILRKQLSCLESMYPPIILTNSPTITGTDSYSYGEGNVVKILPKRDSKGRFCK